MNISSSVGNASSVFWSSLASVNWFVSSLIPGKRVNSRVRPKVNASGNSGSIATLVVAGKTQSGLQSSRQPVSASVSHPNVLTIGTMISDVLMVLAWGVCIPLLLWLGAIAGLA